MEAVEFLKEAKRYCKWCKNAAGDGKKRLCEVCYFEKLNGIFNLPPMAYRKFVETVEEWRKGHPAETRQSEFLKMFPNAKLSENGILCTPPCEVDKHFFENQSCNVTKCDDCRRNFWLKEVE